MEMSHHEIGIVELQIKWAARQHYSRQTAHNEHKEESQGEEERCFTLRSPTPDCRNPTEDLNPLRNGDHHRGCGKKTLAHLWYSGSKHVVNPQSEADESGSDYREDERGITKNWFSNER